jgi:hypothetical protein
VPLTQQLLPWPVFVRLTQTTSGRLIC